MGCPTHEERPGGEGSHGGLQDEDAHPGVVERLWNKIRLHLSRPELGLDGTNNASERSIGKSKVRYKSMRGYKSIGGMTKGIALTQWLYSGADEHDLSKEMAA